MERFANEPDIVVLIGRLEKGKRVSKKWTIPQKLDKKLLGYFYVNKEKESKA